MQIRPEFQVHLLNEAGIDKATAIADVFTTALNDLEKLVPAGRPRSVMITKLQEASFWAKRGIAEALENQVK